MRERRNKTKYTNPHAPFDWLLCLLTRLCHCKKQEYFQNPRPCHVYCQDIVFFTKQGADLHSRQSRITWRRGRRAMHHRMWSWCRLRFCYDVLFIWGVALWTLKWARLKSRFSWDPKCYGGHVHANNPTVAVVVCGFNLTSSLVALATSESYFPDL